MSEERGVEGTGLDRLDRLLAFALALGYLALLLSGVGSLGYARDEGFYVQCAKGIESWFSRIGEEGFEAFRQSSIDRHFSCVPEHPGLMKTLFALSHTLLHEKFAVFRESGTAYRFPGMLMGALAVAVLYLWGRQAAGRAAGFVAALGFAWMPAVFFHAHLACMDVAVAAMWLVTSYAYFRSLDERRFGWAVATGVLYGVFLDTKHNAWLLPFALVVHYVALRVYEKAARSEPFGRRVPYGLLALFVLGPLVFYALWPWIWFDTGERLLAWVRFHLDHDYYNMEFLGRTYWKPPMPRLYAWVMTLATVPAILLVLFAIGLADGVSAAWRTRSSARVALDGLWLLGLCVSYAPWLSSDTPIFGGTKHWITAYPFLCLFAARGFAFVARKLAALPRLSRLPAPLREGALATACLAGPFVMTVHSHPWGLTFYTPLVGGAPGAASLGLNRTFWGYTTGALARGLNERAPQGAAVYVHDTALQSWDILRSDGRVRRDLRPTLSLHTSRLALYHHEAHMRRVEYELWVAYGTRTPVLMGTYDGVPVVWLYERPRPAP
ncbi:MAG TPA: glycosyltransferase family 39 protein [Polyangiaceae bacterium]